jgi:hypothetical protein
VSDDDCADAHDMSRCVRENVDDKRDSPPQVADVPKEKVSLSNE